MIASIPFTPVSKAASKALGVKRRLPRLSGNKGKALSYAIDAAKYGYLVQ